MPMILQEDGFSLLLEDGSGLQIESLEASLVKTLGAMVSASEVDVGVGVSLSKPLGVLTSVSNSDVIVVP